MTLSDWLKQKKITQAKFAEAIGSDQGHVSDLVTGKVRPKAHSMDVIFKATKGAVAHGDWAQVPLSPRSLTLLDRGVADAKAGRVRKVPRKYFKGKAAT